MMRYWLEYDEQNVVPYLIDLPLSRGARLMLAAFLQETRSHADVYIHSPERRLAPGSDCFRVDFVFRDPASRKWHRLELIINDAAAQFGVLRIVYAEDKAYS